MSASTTAAAASCLVSVPNDNHSSKRNDNNPSIQKHSNTSNSKKETKQLQFCWYWHENQYWWPALYFASTTEAQMHCAPYMKNSLLKRHFTSLALQEALQRLKYKNKSSSTSNRQEDDHDEEDSYQTTPTVALFDRNDDYWLIQLDANSLVERGNSNDSNNNSNNNDVFWESLIVRMHETAEVIEGNAPLELRLQGAMQHLYQHVQIPGAASCSTSSSDGTRQQQQQQQADKDDEKETKKNATMLLSDENDHGNNNNNQASDHASVAATAVTAPSCAPHRPAAPVAAAAAAAALYIQDQASAGAKAAAASAAASNSNENDNDDDDNDMMVDTNHNDNKDDDENQAMSHDTDNHNNTSSRDESRKNDHDESSAASSRRGTASGEEWIPPVEGDDPIQPNDVWETVEAKLEFSGWTKRRPANNCNDNNDGTNNNNNQTNGLVSAFWWVKPGRPSENGGVLGQDYFDSVPLLQAFCERAYGWQGPAAAALPPPPPASPRPEPQHRRQSTRGKGGMITPENRKTRPQHPGKPLFIDDDDDDDDKDASGAADSPIPKVDLNDATATGHSSSTTSSIRSRMSPTDIESFARLWPKLRRLGWTAYKGSELEDWIYCKPGIKPGRNLEAQENVDYFKTPDALLEYFTNKHSKKLFDTNQEQEEEEEDYDEQEMDEEEEEEKESNQSQKRKQKESTKKPKPKESTKKHKPKQPTKKRKLVPTAQKPTAKKQKNTISKTTTEKVAMVDPHWWKTVPVPSSNDVWPLLKLLQFSQDANGYYHLPGEDLYNALTFRSLQGLRTFLCLYGIPGGITSFYSEDVETLERWIKFANVPVTKRNSVATLQNIPSPKNDAVLMQMLCDLGCSTVNGNLHLPISDLFRSRRKMNFTHFDLQDPESRKQARIAVRGQLWTFPKLNSVKEERLLQVALWSAKSSSHDLPEFVDLPETRNDPNDPVQMYNKELLKKLSALPALVRNPDDEEPVEEEEEEEEEQSSFASLNESSQEPQSDEDEQEFDSEEEQSDNDEVSVDAVDDEMSVASIDDDDDDSQESSVIEVADLQPKATSTKGKKSSKQAKTLKRPTAIISQTTAKVKKQQQPATESKQQKSNEPWWRTQPIPSGRSIWPFLNRLGFTMDDTGNYHLPAELYDANSFVNLQALRIFLCHYGIPNIDSTSLSKKEKTQLINWVKFANVPVGTKNSVQKLADVQHPTDTTIVHLLCQHGWKTVDGLLYVPNHSYDPKLRSKGVDFFDYDQLESHVRLLVRRRLWRYIYVEKHERQYLQLALWAATAEADLPQFTIPPEESELKKFDDVSDIEDSGESESESDAMPLQQPMAHRKKSKAKSAVERDGGPGVPAYVPKPQKEIKAKKDLRPYFIREPIPVLAQVWSTLEILGFKRNGSTFSHPQLTGKTFADECSLRAFLVKERVDGLAVTRDDFSQENQEMLDHWVKWTFVPGLTPQNSVQRMQDYKKPSESTIDNWLQKVRIQRLDGGFHFPTSDKARQQRREGTHYFVSVDALRVHIRERSNDDLKKIDLLYLAALNSQELFLFRSWAATSDALLPIFTKPLADSRQRRGRRSSLLVEAQSTFAESTCQGDEVDNASPSEETQQESAQKSEMMIADARVVAQQDEVGNQQQSPQQRPLLDDTAMPMQDELDEDGDDESNMQEEEDTRFSASSPVIPLTQPGGGEDDDDVGQDDDDEMSLVKDDSSNLVGSVFSESKALVKLPGPALSPKSPSIGSATNNSCNNIGYAAAPATDASQLAENAVFTFTTLKNNKDSAVEASATETAQRENTTDASHDDLDDLDELNLFTQ